MSLSRSRIVISTLAWAGWMLCLLDGAAIAQFVSSNQNENFGDTQGDGGVETHEEATSINFRLSLSSFLYAEMGARSDPLFDGGERLQTASLAKRVFGDLRLQLNAQTIVGSKVSFQFDGRLRKSNRRDVQSGFRGGQEWDLRDASLRYRGRRNSVTLGRGRIEVADSSKIDGVRYDRDVAGPWELVLFGGLYPARGSRSVGQDYPRAVGRLEDGRAAQGSTIMPVIVGSGARYKTANLHADIGGGAIANFRSSGTASARRRLQIFAHSNGYWIPSERTILYNYATVDLSSATGAALRNLSIGVRHQLTAHTTLESSIHHQSSELLRESTINQLEDPDVKTTGLVQNGAALIRVASQSARASVSADASRHRFQVTLGGSIRQRPQLQLGLADGTVFVFPASRDGDVRLQLLDRRSILGLRLGAQVSVLRGLGESERGVASGVTGMVEVGREFLRGKIEMSFDVAGQALKDSGPPVSCDPEKFSESCYGHSRAWAIQAGMMISARTSEHWLALLDAHWGAETIDSRDINEVPLLLPSVQSVSVFARLRYRYR